VYQDGTLMVSIRMDGMAQALTAVKLLGDGAKEASGPIAAWSSPLVYAPIIETGMRGGRMWRRAGPARMFERGLAETAAAVPGILGPAIIKGPSAVGGARRSIQTLGETNIRKFTPVRTGALRSSVTAVSRPRGA
jgi:hypothetical protein